MDSRIGPSTNASLVLHPYPWGQRHHVTRFSRWRTTLSVIQIPAARIWYKIKAFFLRWPLNQNSHNLFLRSYVLILLGELSWLLKVTLVTWTGESWLLKVTLDLYLEKKKVDSCKSLSGLWLERLMLLFPNKRKRPQNILNEHYLNFAKMYKRVCFLATNKQTGSSCENRRFFLLLLFIFFPLLLPLFFFFFFFFF